MIFQAVLPCFFNKEVKKHEVYSEKSGVSLQQYSYFTLILFLGYSWVYFGAWRSLESSVDERIALVEMKAKIGELEKDKFRLLYQVDDLAQTVAQVQNRERKNGRQIASVDMTPLSDQRAEAILNLFQQKNYTQAMNEIKKFEADFPLSARRAQLWVVKARCLMKKSKTDEAVTVLESVLEAYPDNASSAEALNLLSDISISFEKNDDAIAYLKIIQRQFPDYFKAQELKEKLAGVESRTKSK